MAEAYVWKALADGEKGQFEGGWAAIDDECIRSSGTPSAQLDVHNACASMVERAGVSHGSDLRVGGLLTL